MKKLRTLHLWIGLVCSILILVESVTGLLMSEPWLVGAGTMDRGGFEQNVEGQNRMRNFTPPANNGGANQSTDGNTNQQANGNNSQAVTGNNNQQAAGQNQNRGFRPRGGNNGNFAGFAGRDNGGSSFMNVIRGLHEGRIGNTNVKILVDIAAIAMIILTITGIILSTNVLRANARRKKKLRESGAVEDQE